MPAILNPYSGSRADMAYQKDYGYDYGEFNFQPGSDLHEKTVRRLCEYADMSKGVIKKRYPQWKQMVHTTTSFITADSAEEELLATDERKPTSMVVPMSTAILDTILTYQIGALLEEPYFQYEGVEPDDDFAALQVEMLVQLQAIRAKMFLPLHTMLRDGSLFGVGYLTLDWKQKFVERQREVPRVLNMFGIQIPIGTTSVTEDVLLWEGNRLRNIDVFDALPDPTVPADCIEDGEFFGWTWGSPYNSLLSDESSPDTPYFNVRALEYVTPSKSRFRDRDTESGRYSRSDANASNEDLTNLKYVEGFAMYVNLVPREWHLGESERPQLWYFEVAGDSILIRAEQLRFRHGRLPVVACAPDFDGYSAFPISRLESVFGPQKVIDFEINQHVYNQRKTGNDMLVADPSVICIEDMEDPNPGRVIRINPDHWGRPGAVNDSISQLKYYDTTAGNIRDAMFLIDIMQRVTGATDSVQGIVREGSERRTATEVGSTRQSALNRLKKGAQVAGVQAFFDLGMMLAFNTQQFMSQEKRMKIAGQWEQRLRSEFGLEGNSFVVTPETIQCNLDLLPRNGSIPGGENVQGFMSWLQMMMGNPYTMQRIDILRAGRHIARELGAHNVESFIQPAPPDQVQFMQQQMIQDQLQKGNIVEQPAAQQPNGAMA